MRDVPPYHAGGGGYVRMHVYTPHTSLEPITSLTNFLITNSTMSCEVSYLISLQYTDIFYILQYDKQIPGGYEDTLISLPNGTIHAEKSLEMYPKTWSNHVALEVNI